MLCHPVAPEPKAVRKRRKIERVLQRLCRGGTLWDGTVGACVRGIAAGLDMALVCHTHEVMHASIDAVESALADGTLSDARVTDALARLERMRAFRRQQREASITPFDPSEAFREFVESNSATGDDPTWETVAG